MLRIQYIIALLLLPWIAIAQHSGHEHPTPQKKDSTGSPMPQAEHHEHTMSEDHKMHQQDATSHMQHDMAGMDHMDHSMSHSLSRHLPMNRNGSGTSWNPDSSPIYAWMKHTDKWMLMFMGDLFIRYNHQDIWNAGSRGGQKWDAPDMLMAMAQRNIGKKGVFHFNLMLSTDAIIAGGSGYPLLFQTGESWEGKPLVDRQHPHDLFSELSASYAYSFNEKSDAYVYIGYPGEPALGPTTFMHRPLGGFMPDAPTSHHWADATHITFGIATLGYRYGMFKLEASSFTGREPNENRYNFDKPLFDSWSGRLSFNPSSNWSMHVSHGFLKGPEELHADEDIKRTTASATYVTGLCNERFFSATALWGRNDIKGQPSSNAALLEAVLKTRKTVVYLRAEAVQKTGEELVIVLPGFDDHTTYTNYAATMGAAYDLLRIFAANVAAGAQVSFNFPDEKLRTLYGQIPLSGEAYLHIYPPLMKKSSPAMEM